MREQITGKQCRLEEHHAGIPNLRCPSELWQEDLGHHRLEHEKQERTEKQGAGKEAVTMRPFGRDVVAVEAAMVV